MSTALLTTAQAAKFLAVSAKSLERFRLLGTGPVYIKCGAGKKSPVRYRQADLDAWIEANRFTSTSAYAREVM